MNILHILAMIAVILIVVIILLVRKWSCFNDIDFKYEAFGDLERKNLVMKRQDQDIYMN